MIGAVTAKPSQRLSMDDVVERRHGIIVMTAACCIAFQFFFSVGANFETHPLAIFLLLEATLAALIAGASAMVAYKAWNGRLTVLDVFFFFTPWLFVSISSINANVAFGQPLHFGFIEDRRAFSFLFWFVFDPIRKRYSLTFEDLLLALVATASIYLAVGLLVQTLFPAELAARKLPDEDPRKYRISTPSDCFALCWIAGVTRMLQGRWHLSWTAFLVGFLGLVLIAQTRQFILVCLIVSALAALVVRPRQTMIVGVASTIALAVLGLFFRDVAVVDSALSVLLPNIDEFTGSNLSENTRTKSAMIVYEALQENWFMGLGAVSLLFDQGLQRYFGRNFYLNDLGILGETFRVGILIFVFLFAMAAMYRKLWRHIQTRHKATIGAMLLAMAVLALTSGLFYRVGFVHAFLAAMMMASIGSAIRAEPNDRNWQPR